MGDKSPKKNNAKKPARSMKEKRAAKNEKRREAAPTYTLGVGARLGDRQRQEEERGVHADRDPGNARDLEGPGHGPTMYPAECGAVPTGS